MRAAALLFALLPALAGAQTPGTATITTPGGTITFPITVTLPPPVPGPAGPPGAIIPIPAAQAGYLTRTFGPTAPLGAWLPWNFFGQSNGLAATQDALGALHLTGTGALTTAVNDYTQPHKWRGLSFGGGYYYQAIVSFQGAPPSTGKWPALWALAIEHASGGYEGTGALQVQGQPAGYDHFVEQDFLEAIGTTASYSTTLHEHYGLSAGNASNVQAGIQGYKTPIQGAWSQPQKIGFLWVPATATTQGYVESFYNDQPQGKITWSAYSSASVPPANPYAIGDLQHFPLIITTNAANPMTVSEVSVWQANAASNITD